jgi:hypothetical protein
MSLSAPDARIQSVTGLIGLNFQGLVLFVFFLSVLLRPALFDPDYFWHIESGRLIVAHWALPSGDPFSFTRPGQAWVLHEWLFQVVLYGMFSALGHFGVKLLGALSSFLAVWLVYATAKTVLGRPRPALWLAAVAYLFLYAYALPRPQLLSYVFFGAYLYILLSLKYRKDAHLLPALPLIMILWVNAHGGYVIGIVLVALFCISEWLTRCLGGNGELKVSDLQRLALMVVLTILASLCNPYFISHWAYPFEVMGLAATRNIAEWASPDFNEPLAKLFLLVVGGFYALQIYRARKPDITELAVPGFVVVAAFSSNRHIVLAVMVMSIFAAPALRDGIQLAEQLGAGLQRLQHEWRRRFARGKPPSRAEGLLNLGIAAALGLAAIAYYPTAQRDEAEMVEEKLPAGAAQFVLDNGITGRMFNTYDFGGYLIHRLYPQRRVFVDGRADMYGDAFLEDYFAIHHGLPTWARRLDKYAIDYVICDRDAPIRQLLLARGDYRLVFDDKAGSVLVRNAPRFAGIPTIADR